MRLILALLLLLAGAWAGAAPAWAGEAKTAQGHNVRWDDGLDALGRRVHALLPQVRKEVSAALGFEFRGGPAEVVVVRSHERMREETGAAVPPWAAGVCQGSRSLIVLRADKVDQSPLNPMVSTLRHEWVHLAWSRRAGLRSRTLPRWLEEGLAEEIGGGVSVEAGAQLDFAARFDWLLDFREITDHWPRDASKASLAYKQGRSFVRFFRQKQGKGVFRSLLSDLADGKGVDATKPPNTHLDQLVFAKTGSPLGYWQAVWKTDVEEKADPWFHLLWRDFTGTIFLVIAFMIVFTFYFFFRRRQQQIAELPDDPLRG